MSLIDEAEAEAYLIEHCDWTIMSHAFDINNDRMADSLTTALTFETDKLQEILILIREFLSFAPNRAFKEELTNFIGLAEIKIRNERKKGVANAGQWLIALQKKYKHATTKKATTKKQIVTVEKAMRELERLHANIAINKNRVQEQNSDSDFHSNNLPVSSSSSQKKEATIREDFIEYLCELWFYRKPGRWGTSTFTLNQKKPGTYNEDDLGNDTWLSLSASENSTVSIRPGEWTDNNDRWLHLVSIDKNRTVHGDRRQSFPLAVPYSKNMSKTEQREKIEILVSQVPDEYFRNYVLFMRKYDAK
jgi:hypothetical protein